MEVRERTAFRIAGPIAGLIVVVLAALGFALVGLGLGHMSGGRAIAGLAMMGAAALMLPGFFLLQPNQAKVLIVLGHYTGTVRSHGWHWVNPLSAPQRQTISLRVRNFNSERLKVNDANGNPIEIAAVVVWRVRDTARATFDVDDYRAFVPLQSEIALRHLASQYPYDSFEGDGDSLVGNFDEISRALTSELQERLVMAGVEVLEARLSHLAYAPEIAGVMLRRQQASAIVAARQKMVEGAVGMVDMALQTLQREQIVQLDEERKAAMISNLLVVLTGEHSVQPVVNTGSLYT